MPELPQDSLAAILVLGIAYGMWKIWRSADKVEPDRSVIDLIASIRENTAASRNQLEQFKINNALFQKTIDRLDSVDRNISSIKMSIDRELARQQGEREAKR